MVRDIDPRKKINGGKAREEWIQLISVHLCPFHILFVFRVVSQHGPVFSLSFSLSPVSKQSKSQTNYVM